MLTVESVDRKPYSLFEGLWLEQESFFSAGQQVILLPLQENSRLSPVFFPSLLPARRCGFFLEPLSLPLWPGPAGTTPHPFYDCLRRLNFLVFAVALDAPVNSDLFLSPEYLSLPPEYLSLHNEV